MIDFTNANYLKLRAVSNDNFENMIAPILVEGENIIGAFQGVRDGVLFTNKRIVAINVQGMTGKKKDITSLPYSKIQSFSIETSGILDLDSELVLWFSTLGQIKFEFSAGADIVGICKIIARYAL